MNNTADLQRQGAHKPQTTTDLCFSLPDLPAPQAQIFDGGGDAPLPPQSRMNALPAPTRSPGLS